MVEYDEITYVAVIEASGIQDYIFSSNRQAESVGASYLVARASAFNAARHPAVVPIVESSGKLILGAAERQALVDAIRSVTDTAWSAAPGLGFCGGIAPENTADAAPVATANAAQRLVADAHQAQRREQARTRPLTTRFPVNQLTEICDSGFGPAGDRLDTEARMLGTAAKHKFDAKRNGWEQLRGKLPKVRDLLTSNVEVFDQPRGEAETRWTATIHADGDGIGSLLQDFVGHAGLAGRPAAEYWAAYATFAADLDRVTTEAVQAAVLDMRDDVKKLVCPIIIGGDDVTVILPGEQSLQFAEALLAEFSQRAASVPLLAGLTMSAGIAITKPHFPYHVAYGLAESLTKSAKARSRTEPSLDYHVVYDASPSSLEAARERLNVGAGTPRTAKPFVMGDLAATRTLAEELGAAGISRNTLQKLREAVLGHADPALAFSVARTQTNGLTPEYARTIEGGATRFLDALELKGLER